MKRLAFSFVGSLAVLTWLAPCALADVITFTNSEYASGTGFGNVTNVLSLQATPSESGSVTPTGRTGHATPTSKTWTAAQLTALGFTADNLGIVFNIAEPGNADTVDLLSFSLDFYNSSFASLGSTLLVGTTVLNLPSLGQGTGSSGWLLAYSNTGLLTTFFSNPTNVLGGTGSIGQTAGAQENFYLVRTDVAAPIPEPGTLALLGLGLFGIRWAKGRSKK